jgi:uncharacterized protein (TIGR02594 family)
MNLPKAYQWLAQEPAPRHLLKAVELFGVTESVGNINNPVIMGWAKELGLEKVYTADSIPWCGLYAAIVIHRAVRPVVDQPLWALNWNNFGVRVTEPMLGDILTFTRKSGGHVGFYVGEDATAYHVLGGNQGNKVSVVRILKKRLVQARRPAYNSQPTNVRKIRLEPNGIISDNES